MQQNYYTMNKKVTKHTSIQVTETIIGTEFVHFLYILAQRSMTFFSTNVNFKALLHYTAYAKRSKIITSFISTFPIDCLKFKLCISQHKLNLLKKISFAANVFANANLMCHSGNKIRLIHLKYILFPTCKDTVNVYIRNLHEI